MLFISLLFPPDQTQAGKSEPLRQLEEGNEVVDEEEEEEEGERIKAEKVKVKRSHGKR